MRKFLLPFAMVVAFGLTALPTQKASADDFIDLDLSGVAPGARQTFRNAELFWESRITGYSNTLPLELRSQLNGRLAISADTVFIDGPGGVLGAAGPDQVATFFQNAGDRNRPLAIEQYAIPITSSMVFDVADAGRADFAEVVLHEMGHALGIGSLWQQNGLFDPADPTFRQGLLQTVANGSLQNVGQHALQGFRRQSGHTRANYVPTENLFGPGTALAHWDSDNWFFNRRNGTRRELMTGFVNGRPFFVSEASWGTLADIGWAVEGFNAGTGAVVGLPSRPLFPKSFSSVPEPSSAIVLVVGLGGMFLRRRKS